MSMEALVVTLTSVASAAAASGSLGAARFGGMFEDVVCGE